ncbi:tyrosine recombinase XerC [uncultured Microbacterium sp.]|uniref:site-specific integrase n=1 Tax=uncultured Microbacterium sp. TaxID=191216 RepID=UPI0025EB3CD5|nr:tyrosine-type recombinase/integrase [uncultured Microbacterium sp.]
MSVAVVPVVWAEAISAYGVWMIAKDRSRATVRARKEQLEHMARRIGVGPWEVTITTLLAYVAAQSWMTETRRGRYAGYREFWKWARKVGLTDANPAKHLPKVKPSEPNPDPVPPGAYAEALRHADDRTALMLRLAHDAGMRRAEIAQVHSDDIREDLLGWSLLVHGKGGKQRMMPLTPRLALDLRTRAASAETVDGWLFAGRIDGHLSPRRVGELLEEALPGGWTGHKLRHSFGSNVHEATDGDTLTTQNLLGHANPNTTTRYVRPHDHRLRAAVYAAAGYAAPELPARRLKAV